MRPRVREHVAHVWTTRNMHWVGKAHAWPMSTYEYPLYEYLWVPMYFYDYEYELVAMSYEYEYEYEYELWAMSYIHIWEKEELF